MKKHSFKPETALLHPEEGEEQLKKEQPISVPQSEASELLQQVKNVVMPKLEIQNEAFSLTNASQMESEADFYTSDERWKFALESVTDGLWDWNMATNTVYYSPQWKAMLGYTRTEIGDSLDEWTDRVHPDDLEAALAEAEKHIKGEKDYYASEHRVICKNGNYKWILDKGKIISKDDQGNPLRMVGTHTDITASKEAEDALRNSEERFRTLANSGQALIWTATTDKKCNFFNQIWLDFTGRTIEQESGDGWTEGVHPDDLAHCFEIYCTAFDKREKFSMTYRLRRHDGEYRWLQDDGTPRYDSSENFIGYIGHCLDITEGKRAEEEIKNKTALLTNLIVNLQEGILLEDSDRKIVLTNQLFCDMFGIPVPPEMLIGSDCSDSAEQSKGFFKDPEKFIIEINQILKDKKAVYNHELSLVDGRFLERDYIPTYLNDVYSGHLWKYRDISDRKQAEIKINELNTNLEYKIATRTAELAETNENLQKEIKKRNKVARKLEETLDRLQKIADRVPGVVYQYLLRPDGTSCFPYASEGIRDIYRVSPEEVVTDASIVFTRIHPEDFDGVVASITESARELTLWVHEYRVKFDDGTVRWLLGNALPHTEQDGSVIWHGLITDITERKRIDAALKESEQSHKTVLENIKEIIFQTDTNGLWVFLNKSWEEITGFSIDESIGQLFVNYIHPEDRQRNMDLFTPLMTREKEYCRHQVRYLTKDGGFRWIEVYARLGVNDKNEITGTYGTLQDVTERRYAEEELEESREKYRGLSEASFEAIFISEKGLCIEQNLAAEAMFGYTSEEAMVRYGTEWIIPEDREMVMNQMLSGTEDPYEATALRKDGTTFPCVLRGKMMHYKGKNVRVTSLTDITDRKKAEGELQQATTRLTLATHAGGVGVWEFDIVKNILIWDEQMYVIYGIENKDFSGVYEAWQNGLYYEDKERGDSEIRMAINGEKEFDTEFRVVWPDGTIRNIKAQASVQRDESGKAIRMIGINWDITELKRSKILEEELLKLSLQLTGLPSSKLMGAIDLALSKIGSFLTADRTYIFEFDTAENTMSNTHEWCNNGIQPEIENLKNIPCEIFPMWMATLQRNENVIIPSVDELPESWHAEREILEPQGIQSLIVIPIQIENNLIGFVGLDTVKKKKVYSNSEINILKVWGNMLAGLINNQRIEGILDQTRQNYETFFNTIDDFLFVLDESGNIIHTNNTVIKRLGYPTDELRDQSVLMVHPVERREEAGRIVGEMLAGTADFCPVPLVTRSGSYIPVETRVKRGFWNGKSVIFGVSKDTSKIELSEEKFSKAFQSNSALMAISLFEEGRYFDVNDSFIKTLGYTRDEIIGKTADELAIFVDTHALYAINENLKRNIPVREVELEIRTKSGKIITNLFSADYIHIGSELCLLTVMLDITERKQAEEEIQSARTEAEQANLAKSEFLSRMSHELRTPMNSILGFAQLLDLGDLNAAQKKGVYYILNSGKHLLNLINEVLDISRIEAGRLSLSLEPISIQSVIKEMMEIVQPNARLRNLKTELQHSPEGELFVQADRQRLKQVLLNLINNAIKYNREGGSLTISSQVQYTNVPEISWVRISITDTGMGIRQDDLGRLFHPFERIGAEKTETEGTGLGLTVVKKLMDAMGGMVGVKSSHGEGSTFWIELQLVDGHKNITEQINDPSTPKLSGSERSGTILYIEDNISNSELVRGIIESHRPSIHLITNIYGKLAVKSAIDNSPDLILLDLDLPDIHGSEVLANIQANEKTNAIPVIIVSADVMPQQIEKLMKAGAKKYLSKPIDVMAFLQSIDEWIGN